MAAELLTDASRATDANSNPYAGAKWTFYASGTLTPQAVYADALLSVSLGTEVTADAGGKFVPIYFNAALKYRGILKPADGATTIHDIDPINSSAMSQLALPSGAAQIGIEGGGSVQTALDGLNTTTSGLTAGAASTLTLATASERSAAIIARCSLPFVAVGAIPVGDLIPTAANPIAALRLHQDWILVRVRAASLASSTPSSVYFDEYVFKDPRNYSGVDGGWQLVAHRSFVADKYVSWIIAPDADGGIPNSDFAIRLGKYDAANTNPAYHSGGEGPAYYYCGFGHGRMYNLRTGNQITLNGGGANLQDIANWPVGTRIYGTLLSIACVYKLRTKHWRTGGTDGALANSPIATNGSTGVITITHVAHGYSNGQIVHFEGAAAVGGITAAQINTRLTVTVVNADSYTVATTGTSTSATSGGGAAVMAFPEIVSLQIDHTINAASAITRKGTMTTTLAGFGWQDSYGYMDPINAITATRIKPNGEAAVTILRDGVQKMTSTTGTASQYQAYNDAQTGIFQQFNMSYAQPVRRQGGGGPAAWGLNKAARYFMSDNPDFAKVYGLLCSSEEALPRTAWELSTGDVWEFQSTLKTTYGTLL